MAKFKKGEPRPENAGRRKGTPNKQTVAAKEALTIAFEGLGGVERLMQWANADDENLRAFYQLWVRLLPIQLAGDKDNPVRVVSKIKIEYVESPHADRE